MKLIDKQRFYSIWGRKHGCPHIFQGTWCLSTAVDCGQFEEEEGEGKEERLN